MSRWVSLRSTHPTAAFHIQLSNRRRLRRYSTWRACLLSVSSPRKRGPIRRALSIGLGLWVPACAGTTAERMLRLTLFCSHVKQRDRHAGLAPVALLGRGGSPVFRSFSFPNARGGAPRSACPGFRQ